MKQYQESLSPDKIAQVLVKHVPEQQNYRQSLSPENKTQMLCNDADAHRKQCKSISSEDKNRDLKMMLLHTKSNKSLSLLMTKFKF